MADTAFMEKLVALCKRRGFIFQSSEIYGGIGGFWDYGPLGVELKRNIKNRWWQDMIVNPPAGPNGRELEMVGLDCSIIMNPQVWVASGHAGGFADLMVDCRGCKSRFRADKLFFIAVLDHESSESVDVLVNFITSSPHSGREGSTGELKAQLTVALERDSFRDAVALAPDVIPFAAKKLNWSLFKRCELSAHMIDRGDRTYFFQIRGREDVTRWCILYDALGTVSGLRTICPKCEAIGSLTDPRQFNLMLHTYPGAVASDENKAYLRPETAQGIFCNYKNVLDTSRVKIPFGIGQVGKAFRNEINPRNFTFRSREFEQMEIEFFCRDEDSMMWYEFWRNTRYKWYTDLGLAGSKLRLRDQTKDELAHYSRACADIEYLFPFADDFQELEGVAHRGCFDLTQHAKHSGKDLSYFDEESWAKFLAERKAKGEPELTKDQKTEIGGKAPYRFLPTVIEPSAGADRGTLAFLCEAYHEDTAPDEKGVAQTRVVMRFHPKLAPVKAAIFPLVNKEGMPEAADKLYKELKREMVVQYDDGGAIGRRYRRQDEIGTPFCITIDGETIGAAGATNPGTVTIRERDSLQQHRVAIGSVKAWLKERIGD